MKEDVSIFPTSAAQRRLWFLDQLVSGNPFYNLHSATRFTFTVDPAVLHTSLNEIVRRHESLRTTFRMLDGEPMQVIAPCLEVPLPIVDLSGSPKMEREAQALRLAEEEARQSFDVARGPLIAARLLRLSNDEHVFLLTMHHIISDGWSVKIFWDELFALWSGYAKNQPCPLPEVTIQYADFAVWQERWLRGEEGKAQLDYWKTQLSGLSDLRLPTDRPRSSDGAFEGSTLGVSLPKRLYVALRTLSEREGATLFMVLLAAFQALLHRYSGQEDVVVGAPIANRNRTETMKTIGFFVNSLVLRTDLSGNPTFRELLGRVREVSLQAYDNQDVPFEKLVQVLRPERDIGRNPLFQVSFQLWTDLESPNSHSAGSELLEVEKGTAGIDLALDLWETERGLSGTVEFSTDLFDSTTIDRMMDHYTRLLEGVVSDPMTRLSDLPLMSEAEFHRITVSWNETAKEYPREACLHQLFESQVARTPQRVAISSQAQQLTYRELSWRSNAFARELVREGVRPGCLVAVCMERSLEMVVALLGILKAGGAYLPLDPGYPEERLIFMLEDARPVVLVCHAATAERLPRYTGPRLTLDLTDQTQSKASSRKLAVRARSDHLAYVIYTSGSTGPPKGVMVTHRSVCNHLLWMQSAFPLTQEDRVPQKYSFSFDVSVWEIFGPLLVGSQLILCTREEQLDAGQFVDLILDKGITVIDLVPSQLEVLLNESRLRLCRRLRRITCGGEVLSRELQDRVFQQLDVQLGNVYGPTEATIGSTYWICRPEDPWPTVPIGHPIQNTQVFILDSDLNQVPIGAPGELYVGGDGIAKGYLGSPALTAERFVPNPFSKTPGTRLYKTGDRAKYLPGGQIEYLGRVDEQVKIRGYRIEPAEIESTLAGHPFVQSCAVVARRQGSSDASLVAYVVPREERVELWPSVGEYLVYDELMYHAMTHDDIRNLAYRAAIDRTVAGKVVVDIGTGADAVLARFCVDAGAERVYAIEMLPESFDRASALISNSGLAEKIILTRGDSSQIGLPEPVDVCVSELIGMIGSSEGMCAILNDARRFLSDKGIMIPPRVLTRVAAVSLPVDLAEGPRFSETSHRYVEKVFQTVGHPFDVRVCIKNFPIENILSTSGIFEDLDFSGPVPAESEAPIELTIKRAGRLDGFLLWLNIHTVEGATIDSLAGRHNWLPVFFPAFYPGLDVAAGDRIEAVGSCLLDTHPQKPDYRIRGALIRIDGPTIDFDFRSNHTTASFKATPFYRALFEDARTRPDADPGSAGIVEEQLERWRGLWDETYRQMETSPEPTFNTAGWTDTNALPIPSDEMREQVELTVEKIRRLEPERVLEIGCGTGMLLFPLAPHCTEWVATDFSAAAADYVRGQLRGSRMSQVRVLQRAADDFRGFKDGQFDTVILNSVIQYFPNLDYFLSVLAQALLVLSDEGRIFLGDVPTRRLMEVLYTSLAFDNADDSRPVREVQDSVRRNLSWCEELVLDTELFAALPHRFKRIQRIEVQPKRGWFRNERTKFRCDVVLEVSQTQIPEGEWLDWERLGDFLSLCHLLEEQRPEVLQIASVPDARLQRELWLANSLRAGNGFLTVGRLRERLSRLETDGVEIEALWGLSEELPYEVNVGFSNKRGEGYFDVVLRRRNGKWLPPVVGSNPLKADIPEDLRTLANDPLRGKLRERLVSTFRRYLESRLPPHMIPAQFVVLQSIPLTPSGKLDKQALPAPGPVRTRLELAGSAPQTPIEKLLAKVWEEVLNLKQIGVHENFFTDLGGHSLLATQLVSRIRDAFQIDFPLREIFDKPTISKLATSINELVLQSLSDSGEQGDGSSLSAAGRSMLEERLRQSSISKTLPRIRRRASPDSPVRLSFAQERLWFLDQLIPGNTFYNETDALRLRSPLETDLLKRCLNEIVRRHEAFRTVFRAVDGVPFQVVLPKLELDLPVLDLRSWSDNERQAEALKAVRREVGLAFDLEHGPLIRAVLLRMTDDDFILVLTTHHIVCDGWSMGIVWEELDVLWNSYASGKPSPFEELPIQYADFAIWQREWLQRENLQTQVTYWRNQLKDLPVLELPTDRPRPPAQSLEGASVPIRLPESLTRRLHALSQREGVTLFMTLLAAFQALLHRYTSQDDIVTGTFIANRNQAEVEKLVGFFVNALVLRTDFEGDPSFLEVLRRVREVSLGAYAHQDLPFAKLVEELQPERDLSRNPLFQVAFQLFNAPTMRLKDFDQGPPALEFESGRSSFDLALTLWEGAGGLVGEMEYSTDLFDRVTIERLIAHFQNLLGSIVASPERRVSELPVLSKSERTQILTAWNASRRPLPKKFGVIELFEEQARRSPETVAFSCDGVDLTYRELNESANQLAARLSTLGVRPEVLVGVCLERSLEFASTVLGVLKAGGAYLPLDPHYPAERLAYMLEDSGARLLLTQARFLPMFTSNPAKTFCVDQETADLERLDSRDRAREYSPDHLAYVIYTSGSTGTPKGIAVEHRQLINRFEWMWREYPFGADDVSCQKTASSFVDSIWEFFGPLLRGVPSVIVPNRLLIEPEALVKTLASHRVTRIWVVPSLLRLLLDSFPDLQRHLPHLRFWVTTGEPLKPDLLARFRESLQESVLYNLYGASEVWDVTWYEASGRDDDWRVPIGKPIDNMQTYVLGPHLEPVPVGVPGELYVGGVGLARGYVNRPDMTAERFVPNPFGNTPGARMFKTGDVVRFRADGNLEFLGRVDHQVKIRGVRVEPGEIEALLARHPAVREASVVRMGKEGEESLVAYIKPRTAFDVSDERVAEKIRRRHVRQWKQVWDEIYTQTPEPLDPFFNTSGFRSSYGNLELPVEEVREWADGAVEQILSLRPKRVLEIGCGLGLLLFPITPHVREYVGTDVSSAAVDYVDRLLTRSGATNVELLRRAAHDFDGLYGRRFDTIILNSVAQYFPDVHYLLEVLRRADEVLLPGGSIFLGDVRSLHLLRAFHTSVALYQAPDSLPVGELRRRIEKRILEDEGLALDPSLFPALARELPRLTDVQVLPKRGRIHNEFSKFRYNVFLRVGKGRSSGSEHDRLDWKVDQLSLSALKERLQTNRPQSLLVTGVSTSRVGLELKVQELLESGGFKTVGELRRHLRTIQKKVRSLDPEELWALQESLPYSVQLRWAGPGAEDCDVLFQRTRNSKRVADPMFPVPARGDRPVEAWASYGNDPLQARFSRKLGPELNPYLREKLPDYMVPSAFVILDEFPLTPSGKLDRTALPTHSRARPELGSGYVAPRNLAESKLAELYGEVLGMGGVGVNDNFFTELRGHSLLATRLLARVCDTFEIKLPLRAVFEAPTVAALAKVVGQAQRSAAGIRKSVIAPVARSTGP